jgi:transcriptional regulator with XRE-family HTH domain
LTIEGDVANFAEHFKELRESKGMTLYRLAQVTGLSKQGVSNLEQPDADPKLSTLVKLAEALEVEPWELLPGGEAAAGAGESTALDRSLTELLDELDEIGRMHVALISPGMVRQVAFKLRKLFGAPKYRRGRKGKK